MRLLIVTACGKSKNDSPQPAWRLYKSSRIKAVYNRRNGHEMAILSSRYGLISSDKVIEPYEEVLTEERAKELISQVTENIEPYDAVIYFRGGAGLEYYELLEAACDAACKHFISFGYKHLGEIGMLSMAIKMLEEN